MNIPILLRYFGFWESKIIYQSYESDAIIVLESITFLKLIAIIAMKLNIDEVHKKIKVKYIIEDNSSPIIIRNDNGVRVYMELKKQFRDLSIRYFIP